MWGSAIPLAQYPYFGISGYLSFLGSVNLALPYMLKEFHLSSDLFEIFIATGVITGRFSTMMATMDLLVFSLLCGCAMTGLMRIRFKRSLFFGGITLLVFFVVILCTRLVFQKTVKKDSAAQEQLANMEIDPVLKKRARPKEMIPEVADNLISAGTPLMRRIEELGYLRVGYNADSPSLCLRKRKRASLWGSISPWRTSWPAISTSESSSSLWPTRKSSARWKDGKIDIMMSSIALSLNLLQVVDFSDSYMDADLALLVVDYLRDNFKDATKLNKLSNYTVWAVQTSPFLGAFKEAVPNARLRIIGNHTEFFKHARENDVMLISAEEGSAWTLRYPKYGMVVPQPLIYKDTLRLPP